MTRPTARPNRRATGRRPTSARPSPTSSRRCAGASGAPASKPAPGSPTTTSASCPRRRCGVPDDPNELITSYFFGRPAMNLDRLRSLFDCIPGMTADDFERDVAGTVREGLPPIPKSGRTIHVIARAPGAMATTGRQGPTAGRRPAGVVGAGRARRGRADRPRPTPPGVGRPVPRGLPSPRPGPLRGHVLPGAAHQVGRGGGAARARRPAARRPGRRDRHRRRRRSVAGRRRATEPQRPGVWGCPPRLLHPPPRLPRPTGRQRGRHVVAGGPGVRHGAGQGHGRPAGRPAAPAAGDGDGRRPPGYDRRVQGGAAEGQAGVRRPALRRHHPGGADARGRQGRLPHGPRRRPGGHPGHRPGAARRRPVRRCRRRLLPHDRRAPRPAARERDGPRPVPPRRAGRSTAATSCR